MDLETQEALTDVAERIDAVEVSLRGRIDLVETSLRGQIDVVETSLRGEIQSLRAQALVLHESVREDIRFVAEHVVALSAKVDSLQR